MPPFCDKHNCYFSTMEDTCSAYCPHCVEEREVGAPPSLEHYELYDGELLLKVINAPGVWPLLPAELRHQLNVRFKD